jgi:hypothetical protein
MEANRLSFFIDGEGLVLKFVLIATLALATSSAAQSSLLSVNNV